MMGWKSDKSSAVVAAEMRREASASSKVLREQWFIEKALETLNHDLKARVVLATELLKNRIIVNISRPVTKQTFKYPGGPTRTRVTNRSKPGEFPKADTTYLMKTIFSDFTTSGEGRIEGHVGTPVDYGLFLELYMNRSFLVRSLKDSRSQIERILTAKGGY